MQKNMHSYWHRAWMTYHPIIGWCHIPCVTAKVSYKGNNYIHNANSAGMRSVQDYPNENRSNRKRILLLGDSFAYGAKVNTEQTFAGILEQKNSELDVLNFALGGSGTDQQILTYEIIAKPFQADLCILAIYIENITRNLQSCRPSWDPHESTVYFRPKPYFILENKQLYLHHTPVPLEKRNKENLGNWKYKVINSVLAYDSASNPAWQLMSAIIKRLWCALNPIPLMLLLIPDANYYNYSYPAYYFLRFQELASELSKVYLLDMRPKFAELSRAQQIACHYPGDNHYTPLGHQIVAETIQQTLLKDYPEFNSIRS